MNIKSVIVALLAGIVANYGFADEIMYGELPPITPEVKKALESSTSPKGLDFVVDSEGGVVPVNITSPNIQSPIEALALVPSKTSVGIFGNGYAIKSEAITDLLGVLPKRVPIRFNIVGGRFNTVDVLRDLVNNTTLKELDLSWNDICLDWVKTISEGLKNNSTLTVFKLIGNDIKDDGAKVISKALEGNTTLKELDLSWNFIGDKGAVAISRVLEALTKLNLSYNAICYDGAKALADTLKNNTTLKTLNLGYNHIGDEGAKEILEALKEKEESTLAELNLSGNKIGDEGAEVIADFIRSNGTLRKLGLGENNISVEGKRMITEALKAKAGLSVCFSSIISKGASGISEALETKTTPKGSTH